jgi:DNA polymerase-3 subunit alpha
MAVILLEDLVGTIEVVIFPSVFRQSGDMVRENEIVVVRGKEDRDADGAVRIHASKVTPIEKVEDFFERRQEQLRRASEAG